MKEHEYDGPERRDEYCPVHHIKCEEMRSMQNGIGDMRKSRLPVWVFICFVTVLASILGYMNYSAFETQRETLKLVSVHIEKSNKILSAISHGMTEIGINQKTVMRKLELDFEHVPRYDK